MSDMGVFYVLDLMMCNIMGGGEGWGWWGGGGGGGGGGYGVVRLFEELRYKLESCGFDSRWCHWWLWGRISL